MELIQQRFSIKDLELLSGVKAHTIRIWEKRYGLLEPERSATNIRSYDSQCLQKILNVAFLTRNGYKISRISKFEEGEINNLVKGIATKNSPQIRAIKSLKLAMVNFDQRLFLKTCDELAAKKTFREIFNEVFVPFLDEIGKLWQTDTINPAQEHFVSSLIKQKLYVNIEALQKNDEPENEPVFMLFLPEGEIHELGLLFLQYELLWHNRKSIFLGNNVPMKDLKHLTSVYEKIIFVGYFTVKPHDVQEYIKIFNREICVDKAYEYWILGQRLKNNPTIQLPKNVTYLDSISKFSKKLDS